MKHRAVYVAALAAIAAAAVTAARLTGGDEAARTPLPQVTPAGKTPALAGGSLAKFTYLSQQGTNRCGLQPQQVAELPDGSRLQGACCSKMDPRKYADQVRGLRRYSAMPEIPRDPYDIPVALVKRLLRYRSSIHLTSGETATYRRAMAMSDEKGPCCCQCWRWYAFEGLSKHLIADRHWRAPELAKLIGLLDGCGGSADHPGSPGSTPS